MRWRPSPHWGKRRGSSIFRLLVRKEPNGMSAGALAEAVGCPHNTFSTHVAILARAGLVYGTREGRTITYRANAAWNARPHCLSGHGLLRRAARVVRPRRAKLRKAHAAVRRPRHPRSESKKSAHDDLDAHQSRHRDHRRHCRRSRDRGRGEGAQFRSARAYDHRARSAALSAAISCKRSPQWLSTPPARLIKAPIK